MNAPLLRPYQLELVHGVEATVASGARRVLVEAATGAGKTVIAAEMISRAVGRHERVLFLAHRRELITQASAKLHLAGIDAGIIQAGFPTRPQEPVQIASIATLVARAIRTSSIDMPPADLVIIDEAHHVRARSYRRILAAYPDAIVIGLTATPCRSDGRGLGNAFDILISCPPITELTGMGFLVPARVYAPTRPDLSDVRVERGDYVEKQIAAKMDRQQLVGDVVEHWHKLAQQRRAVVFASSVQHSVHLRDEFRRSGVMAEHVDGSTPVEERDRILSQLATGLVEVVTNCAVLTEGWDQPEVSCCVLARPTKSLGLFRQMVGRVLRTAPGKTDALVLDHAGAVFEHGLIEEPVRWTLKEDERPESLVQRARSRAQAPELKTCPECSAVRFGGQPCPVCGWQPRPRGAAVDVAAGDLGQVDRDRVAKRAAVEDGERTRFFAQLLYIGNERGYARGWAAHKFKEKFGRWPDRGRFVEPVVPDPETRAWVRSRQIAFAKAGARR